MIPLMSLMIGSYIVTRMMIFMLSNNHNQYKPEIVINKLLAALTVIITVICVILIFRSSINPFDMESILKPDVLPSRLISVRFTINEHQFFAQKTIF